MTLGWPWPILRQGQICLRTSKYVFPLFNFVNYIFKIRGIFCIQGPFEIISRLDEQLVHINSFLQANGTNKIKPKDLENAISWKIIF